MRMCWVMVVFVVAAHTSAVHHPKNASYVSDGFYRFRLNVVIFVEYQFSSYFTIWIILHFKVVLIWKLKQIKSNKLKVMSKNWGEKIFLSFCLQSHKINLLVNCFHSLDGTWRAVTINYQLRAKRTAIQVTDH